MMMMVRMAQQQKSRLGNFLGKKCEIGAVPSGNSSSYTSVNRLTPLEKANKELMMYLQYRQLIIEDWKESLFTCQCLAA